MILHCIPVYRAPHPPPPPTPPLAYHIFYLFKYHAPSPEHIVSQIIIYHSTYHTYISKLIFRLQASVTTEKVGNKLSKLWKETTRITV